VQGALAAVVAAVLAVDEAKSEFREQRAGAAVGLGDGEAQLDDGHAAARERGLADGSGNRILDVRYPTKGYRSKMKSLLAVISAGSLLLTSSISRGDFVGTTTSLQPGTSLAQDLPAISGTRVEWTSYNGSHFDIYYVDVASTQSPINLTNTANDGDQFIAAIDGSSIAFTNTKVGALSSDIELVDATTQSITSIASGGSTVNFAHPALDSAWIVFERITSQYDIDLVDRTTNSSPGFQVTFDAASQRIPRISGNVVVYEDYNEDPNVASVAGCTITYVGCSTFSIASVGREPDIDADHVVYVGEDANGEDQIYLYTVSTSTTTQLTTAPSIKSHPRISGNRVVWSDNRNGNYDIYGYDLTLAQEGRVAGGTDDQSAPSISGTRVVYQSTPASGGPDQAYMFKFSLCTVPCGSSCCYDIDYCSSPPICRALKADGQSCTAASQCMHDCCWDDVCEPLGFRFCSGGGS